MLACAWGGAVLLLEFSVGNCTISWQHLPLHGGICALLSGAQQGIGAALCIEVAEQMRAMSPLRAVIGHAHESDGTVNAHSANKAIKIKGKRRH